MTPLSKHIWLIRQLQKKSMTFEEINEKWLRDRRGTEDENIPILKRTFHNHINAIRKEYGIDIVCGSGYKYYIDNPDYVVASQIERLSILNMMNETVSVNRSLFVEDNFQIFRDDAVVSIMDAIKAKHKIKLDYGLLHLPEDRFRFLNIAPYQLHHMDGKWYLLGQADKFGLMRIPLFLIGKVQITHNTYKFPFDYSSEEYCKMIYGTTNKWIRIAIKIQDLHPERLNLDKYPLIPFHQEVSSIDANDIRINIDLPKNPFALHMLKSRLGYYTYTVLNDTDPFTLFSEEQYNNEVYFPVAL
jgi:hypothetical protein